MRLWSRLFGASTPPSGPQALSVNDPVLKEWIRAGGQPARQAMEVSAVFRSITLLTGAIAMLPLRVMERSADGSAGVEAVDHPLFELLMHEPNARMSAFEFKRLMEMRLLVHGNAYARIVRTGARVAALLPVDPERVRPLEQDDGTIAYEIQSKGGVVQLTARDMLHLRGFSLDGVTGLGVVKLATDAIGLSTTAAESLSRIYKTGVTAGGALQMQGRLSKAAKENLKEQLEAYQGSTGAGRWMVLDEGMSAQMFGASARDNQTIETLRHQVEDIARFFGVPRPLLGLDDTSWGSGVEQLAILFVRFGLAPSMVAWEQALRRALLTREEKRRFAFDFDERELLRGSMKDQAEFFARAMGAGGSKPWMTANEIRDLTGLSRRGDGDDLLAAPASQKGQPNVAS